jgi:hypothetical protein
MGRKAIHKPEKLGLGERMELKGKLREFSWQYLNNFNKRGNAKYAHRKEGEKVFIERIS